MNSTTASATLGRLICWHRTWFWRAPRQRGLPHELRWSGIAAVDCLGNTGLLVHRSSGSRHRLSFAGVHQNAVHCHELLAHYQAAIRQE